MLQTFQSPKLPVMPKLRLVIGLVIWSAAWCLGQFPLEVAILLFAPLVIVPLVRGLVRSDDNDFTTRTVQRILDWIHLPAAVLLVISFTLFPQGNIAGLLTIPWACVTLLLAASGVMRWWRDRGRWLDDFGIIGGLLLISVGGFWVLATRFGWRPGGFDDKIVLLSGVHFHYAAFALPVLATIASRPSPTTFGRASMIGVTIGVPLVGAGISFSPTLEVFAVALLLLSCCGVAGQQMLWIKQLRQPQTKLLALVSCVSLLTGMSLAAIYGLAEFLGTTWLSIPTMIATHGIVNAFGFVFCGLLAAYGADREE